jgi:hypothetical protein
MSKFLLNPKTSFFILQIQKYKNILIGIGIVLAIIAYCLVAYFMNWEGIFHHNTLLTSDNYFSINMPGDYTKTTKSYGEVDPITKSIYEYDNESENNRLIFYVTETNYPELFSDKQINDLFLKSPENNLIQNFSTSSTDKETIKEKTNSTYLGYQSINVTKIANSAKITTYLRYIKVGHIIYEISLTGDDSFNNYPEVFKRYADSFKILSDNNLKTASTQGLAPTLLACDQLPQNYIDQVMSSTITNKEESNLKDSSGTQCFVEGTIANGPNWVMTYTVEPTAESKTIHVDKQDSSLGVYYSYENGRYKGALTFITQGTSPADEQISNDLTMELARSLQAK